jgi:hypothetical protein
LHVDIDDERREQDEPADQDLQEAVDLDVTTAAMASSR